MQLINGIGMNGKPENIRTVNGAMVTTEGISSTPDEAVTGQDVTTGYVSLATVNMDGYSILGVLVKADVNASTNVSFRVMGMMNSSDTPFEVDAFSVKTLWTGTVADFEKYFQFATGALPYADIQVIAGTTGFVAAYLTGGSSAESTFGTWAAKDDGAFQVDIDGTTYNIGSIDFSGDGSMADVAATLQAAIRAATGSTETCIWDTDHFVITSVLVGPASAISVTDTFAETDISGVGATPFMDAETGQGTASARVAAFMTGGSAAEDDYAVWELITDGSFRITVDGTDYNVDAIDFSGDASMADVAATIQAALRTATSALETVAWSTDHFVFTSVDATATSAVSVLRLSTGTVGTNIAVGALSDASTNGVVTAVAAAYLTGGTAATAVVATWIAVTDGSLSIDIDGTTYNMQDVDFSTATDMDDVAALIQVALRAATTGTETVVWSTDHFIVTSTDLTTSSEASVTAVYPRTDISGAGVADWMDCDTGNGTETAVVAMADISLEIVKA